jgi:hypothetical protein
LQRHVRREQVYILERRSLVEDVMGFELTART